MHFWYDIAQCYYLLIRDLTCELGKRNRLKEVLIALLTILLTLIIFLTFFPFYLLKKCVEIYLRIKYGKQYGGVLPAMDAVFEGCSPKVTINIVYVLSHKGNEQQLHQKVKKMCEKLHNSNFKFSSIVETFFGYRYYRKDKVGINDVVSKFKCSDDECVTKEDFLKSLDRFYDRVTSDKRLWDVNICTQRLLWNKESHVTPHYALIIRTNHSVADAHILCLFHKKYLTGEFMDVTADTCSPSQATKTESVSDFGKVNIHKMGFPLPSDFAVLVPHIKASQFYAFINEEQVKYLPILKKLKNKYHITISDILTAGAVDSIFRYFEKESFGVANITCTMTCRSLTEDITSLLNGNIFANEATAIIMSLPKALKCTSSINRLDEIAEICKRSRFSMDRQLIYTHFKLADYLPSSVVEYFFHMNRCSLGLSNVPLPNIDKIGGMPVQDLFGFVNQFGNLKFVLSIVSFNNRLHASLMAKKGMVETRQDLQDILNNVFGFIDRVVEEDAVLERAAYIE